MAKWNNFFPTPAMQLRAFSICITAIVSACVVMATVAQERDAFERRLTDTNVSKAPPLAGSQTNSLSAEAYNTEIVRLVVEEANKVATQLKLEEPVPIRSEDLIGTYVTPYALAKEIGARGNVATRNFGYFVSLDSKFSFLIGMHQEEDCRKWQKRFVLPTSRIDTNAAYQMATQWLAAGSMDVEALNRDYPVVVEVSDPYLRIPAGRFLPVYWVYWAKLPRGTGSVASVRLFAPLRKLMQLRVEEPKYIRREALKITTSTLGSHLTPMLLPNPGQ